VSACPEPRAPWRTPQANRRYRSPGTSENCAISCGSHPQVLTIAPVVLARGDRTAVAEVLVLPASK
jgi:hypothetical protein